MRVLALIVLSVSLAWELTEWGGVLQQSWNYCLLSSGLVLLLWTLYRFRALTPPVDPPLALLLLLLGAYIAFQCVPLPLGLLSILSPARARILAPLGAALGHAPAWATLSNAPAATAAQWLRFAGYAAVFLVIRGLVNQRPENGWRVAAPLLVLAAFQGAFGVLQASDKSGSAMATGTFYNHNHFAGFLELCFPLALLHAAWFLRRNPERHSAPLRPALLACALLGIAALLFAAILLSLSRMGFLAALASILILGALCSKRRYSLSAALILTVGALVFLPSDQLIGRFAGLAAPGEVTADIRSEIWQNTTTLIHDYPFFGCGFGAFESSLFPYKTVAPMNNLEYAHSDYLQLLAEFGIAGALILAALAIRIFTLAYRASQDFPGSPRRYLALGCIGSLSAIAVHSIVDFNLYIPTNGMVVAWITGIVAGLSSTGPRMDSYSQLIVPKNAQKRSLPSDMLIHDTSDLSSAPALRAAMLSG